LCIKTANLTTFSNLKIRRYRDVLLSNANDATQWVRVGALFLAGCSSAFHIGKVPAALPVLSAEMDLSLLESSFIVSVFSVLVSIFGLLIGFFATWITYKRAALLGLVVASIASVVGANTNTLAMLLVSRSLEGLGWILAAVSIPALMVAASELKHRPVVLGLWGAFLPTGAATFLLLSPWILSLLDWKSLWLLAGCGSGVGASTAVR